ncbi:hypothetical protein BGZ67_006409 [Mortierella alpina]|nr:hypothetical protein BGZ67_006409 [Mortierella alpina]
MHESLARDDAPTPEMHLETLFPEEDAGRMKPRAQKASTLSSSTASAQSEQPLRNVSNTTPQGDERTGHREKPSVSPELNVGTLFSEPSAGALKETGHDTAEAGMDDGFQGYVFHPPRLARGHDSRHEHSAHSQASPAHEPETQKLRHVPAQRPEYHAPVHTPPPQQATFEHVSASRQQTSQKNPSSAPLKKKTWYGVEVPDKQKASPPKSNAGSKHPLSLGFGFREIRKVAKAGQSHSSGPSTPVSSSEYMQAARVNVPLQNAPLYEDRSKPKEHASSDASDVQPANQKPTQASTGSRTHQVLGDPYDEPSRVGTVPKERAARETSGVHPASYHVPLQNQGHSSTFGIKDSTVDSHPTSNSGSRHSRLDQAFEEPSGQRATIHAQGTAVAAAAENAFQAGLGGIRSLVDAAMHVPAMMAHALLSEDDDDEQQEFTSTALSHDHTTLGSRSMKRGHPKAVMLKRPNPRVDLTLYPEEDPSYPRGDGALHENPAFPSAASLKSFADDRTEPFHALSAGLFKQPGHAKSQVMPSARSSADTRTEHAYNHTKAAALKKPTQNVMLFAEEDGSYPRDSSRRRHKNPDHPSHLVEDVHEVQLDAAHLHPHHDLHPTVGESAAAAIASGVEGMRAMLSGIKLHYISDSLLAPEGRSDQRGQQHQRRHSNAAAGAVLSQLGRSTQSTQQQWNVHGRDSESFSHRGDAYYGQHGDLLAGHTHVVAASTKPISSAVSASKVPLETGHRGDAYYGQHEDMPDTGSSVHAMSKETSKNTFPLEFGHRGDAYFGQHEEQGHHSSSSSRSAGPIYSPVSSPSNLQRNFPLESRHRGDAYYDHGTEETRQGSRVSAQTNPFPAAVQQVEQQQKQKQQQQQQQHQHQGGLAAQGHVPPLQSPVAPLTQQQHRPDHTPSSRQGLPEYANAFPSAVQDLDHTELNRPHKPVPTVSPAVVRQHQASIQQSRAQQQQQQQQQQSVPPEHANVYASAVRRTEQQEQEQQQQQQQQQQGQPLLQEPLNEGEKVVWVKKVKVTDEFYDADDGLDSNAAHPVHGISQPPHQHQEQTAGRRQPAGPAQ